MKRLALLFISGLCTGGLYADVTGKGSNPVSSVYLARALRGKRLSAYVYNTATYVQYGQGSASTSQALKTVMVDWYFGVPAVATTPPQRTLIGVGK